MKAVIVDLRGKFAAALSDDGCIIKVRNDNYAIGQVIELKKMMISKPKRLAAWAACAAVVVSVCGAGAYAFRAPYSYVSLDVNPSIEYTLNRFDQVLTVEAVNGDGQEILNAIEPSTLNNQNIEDAISATVAQISKEGYFDGSTEGGIVIATSANNEDKAQALATDLQQTVEANTAENGDKVEVEAISVGRERVEQARKLGVTPGKLNLVEKLKASAADPNSVNIEEWLKKPVKDIMKATKENRKAKGTTAEDAAKTTDTTDNAKVAEQSATAAAAEEIKPTEPVQTQSQVATKAQTKVQNIQQKAASKTEQVQKKTAAKVERTEQTATAKIEKTEQKAADQVEKIQQDAASKVEKTEQKAAGTEAKNEEKVKESTSEIETASSQSGNSSDHSSSGGSSGNSGGGHGGKK